MLSQRQVQVAARAVPGFVIQRVPAGAKILVLEPVPALAQRLARMTATMTVMVAVIRRAKTIAPAVVGVNAVDAEILARGIAMELASMDVRELVLEDAQTSQSTNIAKKKRHGFISVAFFLCCKPHGFA